MAWYWIVFSIIAIAAGFEQFGNLSKKKCEAFCGILSAGLIVLSTVRWNQVNGDWQNYYRVFNELEIRSFFEIFKISFKEWWNFEPLFYIVMRFSKYVFGSYLAVQFFMAAVSIGFFYKAAKYLNTERRIKDTTYGTGRSTILLTYLLAWGTECLSLYAIRSSMATAVCLFSICYIEGRNLKKFAACILFAAGIHFASIVFIPAYFIYKVCVDAKTSVKFAGAAAILSLIGAPRLIRFAGLLGGRYAGKAAGYNFVLPENYLGEGYGTFFIIMKAFANTAAVMLLCFMMLIQIKKKQNIRMRVSGLFNLYFFGALIQIVLLPYNFQVARAAIFYINQQYFIIPMASVIYGKNRSFRCGIFILTVLYAALKMYVLLHSSIHYNTYYTIFSR